MALKFHIKTYGCQMNERDSDSASALLIAHGYIPTEDENEAEIVILNTCSVRDQAERKAIGKLGIMKRIKAERQHMIFGLMGCMAQSRGEELLKTIPHLDFVIGTDQIHSIPDAVEQILNGTGSKLDLRERCGADTPGIDMHRTDTIKHNAFISIMRGCDRYCSYCIVPYVRGHERSRNPESIVEEARELVRHGVKEIMLLGQNVAAFGLDRHAPNLPDDLSPFAEAKSLISAQNVLRCAAKIFYQNKIVYIKGLARHLLFAHRIIKIYAGYDVLSRQSPALLFLTHIVNRKCEPPLQSFDRRAPVCTKAPVPSAGHRYPLVFIGILTHKIEQALGGPLREVRI